MKTNFILLAILLTVCSTGRAQAVPATTGTAELPVNGTLHYDLRYSQIARSGGYEDGQHKSYISGDASIVNAAKRLPFTMLYGGGYGRILAGPDSVGNFYQHLSLSQGVIGRAWSLTASDNVSYTFETPTTGFSGVPGTGESISRPGPTLTSDQTILTQNTRTLDNTAALTFNRKLNYAMTLNVQGSSGQLRYIDNNGQDMDTLTASASVSRRLNARNSTSGQYSYSRFNYNGAGFTTVASTASLSFMQISTAQFGFTRQWNRKLNTSAFAGPQRITSSNSTVTPTSTRLSAKASANGIFRFGTASLSYSHKASGGSGYMPGAETDDADVSISRNIGRNWDVELTGSYRRTSQLNGKEATNAKYGGAQATRKLGRYFNLFVNYTATDQSSNLPSSTNALNSLSQIIGFGIGYSSREMYLKK